jgi:cytochrome P450
MQAAQLPPGPSSPSFVQGFRLGLGIYDYLGECAERYGDAFTIRVPGLAPMVWVSQGDMVRDFFRLKSHQIDQQTLPVPLDIGDEAIGFTNGAVHEHSRRVLIPPFAGRSIQNRLNAMHHLITQHIDALQPGQTCDITGLIAETTLDIVAYTLVEEVDSHRFQQYRDLLLGWLEASTTPTMFAIATLYGPSRWRNVLNRKYKASRGQSQPAWFDRQMPWGRAVDFKLRFADMVREDIRKIRARPDADHKGVLAAIALSRYDDGQLLDEEKVITEVISIFVGGHDTSAATGSWYMLWMLKRPDVVANMRTAVEGIISEKGGFDASAVVNHGYLDACLNESQRLTPSAVGTMRHIVADTQLGSLFLPAHTNILAASYLTHRRRDIWGDDAGEYRPERWLDESRPRPKPWEFYPFGGGHRACIGLNQAKQQLRLLFAEFARRVEFSSRYSNNDLWPGQRQINVQTHPAGGVQVRIEGLRH